MTEPNLKSVTSSTTIMCIPFVNAEIYFKGSIESEGNWAKCENITTYYPRNMSHESGVAAAELAIKEMKLIRENQEVNRVKLHHSGYVDVAFIDFIVDFRFSEIDKENPIEFFKQHIPYLFNLNMDIFFKNMKQTVYQDMMLLQALHFYDSRGDMLIHIHNTIFSVHFMKDNSCLAADMNPLIEALSRSGKQINVYNNEIQSPAKAY